MLLKRWLVLLLCLWPLAAYAEIGGQAGIGGYSGMVGITGNQGNGSDAINHVNALNFIDVTTYNAVCDGVHDDAPNIIAAVTAAAGTGKTVLFPGGKTCAASQLNFTGFSGMNIAGAGNVQGGAVGSTLLITGSGGGACTGGVNGGIIFGAGTWAIKVHDLNISFSNTALDCLVNIGHANGVGLDPQRIEFSNVTFGSSGGIIGTTTKAVFVDNAIVLDFNHNLFDNQSPFGHFQYGIYEPTGAGHYWTTSVVGPLNQFQVLATTTNYQVTLGTGVQTVTFRDNNFETGPNGIECGLAAANGVSVMNNIFQDAITTASGTWVHCSDSGGKFTGNSIFKASKGIQIVAGTVEISGNIIGQQGVAGVQEAGTGIAIRGNLFQGSATASEVAILSQGTGTLIGSNRYGSVAGAITHSIQLNPGSSGFLVLDTDAFNDQSTSGIVNSASVGAWTIDQENASGTVAGFICDAAHASSRGTVGDSTSVAAEGQPCVGGSNNNALVYCTGSVKKCF